MKMKIKIQQNEHGFFVYVGDSVYNLRDYPYRDELNRLVFPIDDGTNLVCDGETYPTSISFGYLDYSNTESATIETKLRYSP